MKKDLLIQAHENGCHQGVDRTLYRLKLGALRVNFPVLATNSLIDKGSVI